jgi:hypothetical protein
LVVQDFDGVAVDDGDDGASEVRNGSGGAEQEQKIAESKDKGNIFFSGTRGEARQKTPSCMLGSIDR